MKNTKTKRLTVSIIALIIGGTCAFGATACDKNSGNEPASVIVDEVGWTEAFEKTLASSDFTMNMKVSVKNIYKTADQNKTIYTSETQTDYTQYTNENLSYATANGTFSLEYTDDDSKVAISGSSEGYNIFENTNYYLCAKGTTKNNGEIVEEMDWHVNYSSSYYDEVDKEQIINSHNWSQQVRDSSFLFLKDSFFRFSYKNGTYCSQFTEGNNSYDYRLHNIYIKINSDGYISYFREEVTSNFLEDDLITITNTNSVYEIKLYDFGKTNIMPVPAAVQKAIEDYKASENN